MTAMRNVRAAAQGLVLAVLLSALAGCARSLPGPFVLSGGQTVVLYDPAMDRAVYLGQSGGPNVLELSPDLYRPTTAYPYWFRGGSYTWLAPQSEWVQANGERRAWPPEPAMDSGPMSVRHADTRRLVMVGPRMRRNFHERKEVRLDDDGTLFLSVTLVPDGKTEGKVSIWSTTAVTRGAIVAIPKGTVRSDNEEFAVAWKAAARESGAWQVVDTEKLAVAGKAFLDAAPVIASWRRGWWFARIGSDATSPRSGQDAVIEVFVARDEGVIELELIGPYREVTPDGRNTWSETWRLIQSDEPTTDALDKLLDRAPKR